MRFGLWSKNLLFCFINFSVQRSRHRCVRRDDITKTMYLTPPIWFVGCSLLFSASVLVTAGR